jgi:hypothetical protein
MNARANLIVSRVCWIAMAIIAIGLIFGPALCFGQMLGRPASESYVTSKINSHASTNNAHADIRASVFAATTNINALAIDMTNVTEKANAAILKNTQQDVDISNIYASNANAIAIANLANTRAQTANVTNAQNTTAITSVSNMVVQVKVTADAAATTSFVAQAISNAIESIPASSGVDSSRIVTADGSRWIDATGGVWQVDAAYTVTNSNYGYTLESTEGNYNHVGETWWFVGYTNATHVYTNPTAVVLTWEHRGVDATDWWIHDDWSAEAVSNAVSFSMSDGAFENDLIMVRTNYTDIVSYSAVTSRVDTVALLSDIEGIPTSGVNSFGGSATNLSLYGKTTMRNAAPTNLIVRLYLSNDTLYAEHIIP